MASSTRRSSNRVPLDDAARRRAERTALAGTIRRTPVPDSSSEPSSRGPKRSRGGDMTGPLLFVLAVVVGALLLVAPQLKVLMSQRVEVAELQADIEAKRLENEQLSATAKRYDDPAFVKQQARDRLFMVMPGETRYMVTGDLPGEGETVAGSAASHVDLSWNQSLLDATRQAAR